MSEQPQKFGRFEVIDVLGRGSMGVVYRARDPLIGREVAIKAVELNAALELGEMNELRTRFEVEARSAGSLSHPNIVTLYDIGQQDNFAFIALEYLPGGSLEDALRSGRRLGLEQVADLVFLVSNALDKAHEAGIVHRDIKPANILITADGRPKLTDFGIAKLTTTDLTQVGMVVGTPAYMSPEQVTGRSLSGASDQFSLGIMLYRIFTGTMPFQGDSPTVIMYKIVNTDPDSPRTVNETLPAMLDGVLLRALSKKPEDRFPSCTAFAIALREALGLDDSGTVTSGTAAAGDVAAGDVAAGDVASEEAASEEVADHDGRQPASAESDDASASAEQAAAGRQPSPPPTPPPLPAAAAKPRRRGLGIGLGVAAILLLVGVVLWQLAARRPANVQVAQQAASPTTALPTWPLEVSASPAGAAIWIDGEDTGLVAPAQIELPGVAGDKVRIELVGESGLAVRLKTLTLGPQLPPSWPDVIGETPTPESDAPTAVAGRYRITSRPQAATVELNGEAVGSTPLELDLEPGIRYEVLVKLEDHKAAGYTFSLDSLSAELRSSKELFFPLTAIASPPPPVVEEPAPPAAPIFEPAVKRTHVQPSLPRRVRRRGGTIMVQVAVDAQGTVTGVEITGSSLESLSSSVRKAVTEAVSQWTYQPALQDGEPVPTDVADVIDVSQRR